MRNLRWLLVAGVSLALAGAAYAGSNCDGQKASASSCGAKKAQMEQASAAGCGAKAGVEKASAGGCTAAQAASCTAAQAAACGDKAMAHADCPFCTFTHELGANADKVSFTTQDTENGVIVVFAATNPADVPAAQAVASKAYAMMNAPAHCAVSRAKMESKSCDGCKSGLDAFAGADVKLENTDNGARAEVVTTDAKNVEKLHAFFKDLQAKEQAAAKG